VSSVAATAEGQAAQDFGPGSACEKEQVEGADSRPRFLQQLGSLGLHVLQSDMNKPECNI